MPNICRVPLKISFMMVFWSIFGQLMLMRIPRKPYTDGAKLYTPYLLVKHYNDLLDRQSSERGRDEVTFYDGDVFYILWHYVCMPIFKKKSSRIFLGKSSKLFMY